MMEAQLPMYKCGELVDQVLFLLSEQYLKLFILHVFELTLLRSCDFVYMGSTLSRILPVFYDSKLL